VIRIDTQAAENCRYGTRVGGERDAQAKRARVGGAARTACPPLGRGRTPVAVLPSLKSSRRPWSGPALCVLVQSLAAERLDGQQRASKLPRLEGRSEQRSDRASLF
jgi:hypothetical protein